MNLNSAQHLRSAPNFCIQCVTESLRRTKVLSLAFLALLPAAFTAAPALAQTAPTAALPTPKPPNLAQALATAMPSAGEIYLAVDASSVKLPSDVPAPAPGEYVNNTAYAYGRLVQAYDTVNAIAPPTMLVLNANPGTPNPYDGMPASDAFKLLLGSLDDGEWTLLTSADSVGLGYSDLTNDDQRALWNAMFPAAPLQLSPDWRGNQQEPVPYRDWPKLSRADALQAHLRFGRRVTLGVPEAVLHPSNGEGSQAWGNLPDPAPDDPDKDADDSDADKSKSAAGKASAGPADDSAGVYPRWQANQSGSDANALVYGKQIRAEVPNVLKPSELDYDAPRLRVAVNPTGAKTVDDLVARIASATHLELYSEPAYASLPITLVGTGTVNADELLRALALCVCGTYRQVGPAFVLTDDEMGVGVRRLIIARYAQLADAMRARALANAGDKVLTVRHGMDGLAFLDPNYRLNDAEKKADADQRAKNDWLFPGSPLSVQIGYAQLSDEQKKAVDKAVADSKPDQSGEFGPMSKQGQMLVQTEALVYLTAPSVDGAVDMQSYFQLYNFYQPSNHLQQERSKALQAARDAAAKAAPAKPQPPSPPKPSLAALNATMPLRGLLVHPENAADVDKIIRSAKQAGFNQVWVDVFANGKSSLADAMGSPGPDILTAAVKAGKAAGLNVIAAVSLLNWQKNTPPDAEDVTLDGTPYGREQMGEATVDQMLNGDPDDDQQAAQFVDNDNYVSPVAPTAVNTLAGLIASLASVRGLSGIALRDTAPPGYDLPASRDGYANSNSATLGYSPDMRLAYLRKMHEDPIDIDGELPYVQAQFDMSLPYFPGGSTYAQPNPDWNDFRKTQNQKLLTGLYSAARSPNGGHVSIWISNRRTTQQADWYGVWDGDPAHLPDIPDDVFQSNYSPDYDYAGYAHSLSVSNMIILQQYQAQSVSDLIDAIRVVPKGWNGYVVDYSSRSEADPVGALLLPHPAAARAK